MSATMRRAKVEPSPAAARSSTATGGEPVEADMTAAPPSTPREDGPTPDWESRGAKDMERTGW